MERNDTLSEWYLRTSWNEKSPELGQFAVDFFLNQLSRGRRIGQAFFNSLSWQDQQKLRGSLHDPFYFGVGKTHEAIDFLTSK